MCAAMLKKHDQVARLLRYPAVLSNLEARSKRGETALWLAAKEDDKAIASHFDRGETVKLLLATGRG